MVIGTTYWGSLYKYKGQCIETSYFTLGLPLIPTGSIYRVTDSVGFEMPLNRESFWNGFSKTTILAVSVIFKPYEGFLSWLCWLLIINALYQIIKPFLQVGTEESKIRDILQKAFDYNMLPERLPQTLQAGLYQELLKKYKTKFGENVSWEEEIKNKNINLDNQYMLYALAYYSKVLTNNDIYEQMKQIVKQMANI
jgi:hypothetical protein